MVDVLPEVKWNPENGYKNLKIVVEIDNEITAEVACELELKRRHKTLGVMRIVADRGLQVIVESDYIIILFLKKERRKKFARLQKTSFVFYKTKFLI